MDNLLYLQGVPVNLSDEKSTEFCMVGSSDLKKLNLGRHEIGKNVLFKSSFFMFHFVCYLVLQYSKTG